MQVTKGTWRMREQCVPGSLSSSPAREPGNEANVMHAGSEVLSYFCLCESYVSMSVNLLSLLPHRNHPLLSGVAALID